MRTLAKAIAGCALIGALLSTTGCGGYDHNSAIPMPTSTQESPWFNSTRPTEPSAEKIKQALKRVNACRLLSKKDVELAFTGSFTAGNKNVIEEGVPDAECAYTNTTEGGAVKVRIRYDPRGAGFAAAEKLADTTGQEPSEPLGNRGSSKALYNSDGREIVFLHKKYYVSLLASTDHEPRDQLVALAQLVLLNLDDQLKED